MDTKQEELRKELAKARIMARQDFIQNKLPFVKDVPPCPFCGQQPKTISTDLDGFGHLKQIRCVNPECDVRPFTKPCETIKEAKEQWSKRI